MIEIVMALCGTTGVDTPPLLDCVKLRFARDNGPCSAGRFGGKKSHAVL